MSIPATDKRVVVKGVVIDRLSGGKMADSRILMDTMSMMRQLGAIPDAPPVAMIRDALSFCCHPECGGFARRATCFFRYPQRSREDISSASCNVQCATCNSFPAAAPLAEAQRRNESGALYRGSVEANRVQEVTQNDPP